MQTGEIYLSAVVKEHYYSRRFRGVPSHDLQLELNIRDRRLFES
jgi:hypothetical protein